MTAPRASSFLMASRRTHLLAAAGMWSLVGLALIAVGARWTCELHSGAAALLLLLAAVVGWLKARFVLYSTASRVCQRIQLRGDGRFLGGFLSWPAWCLVLGMIVLGRLLRASPLPVPWRGTIYCAIGTALFLASLRIWEFRRRLLRG